MASKRSGYVSATHAMTRTGVNLDILLRLPQICNYTDHILRHILYPMSAPYNCDLLHSHYVDFNFSIREN